MNVCLAAKSEQAVARLRFETTLLGTSILSIDCNFRLGASVELSQADPPERISTHL